MRNQKFNSKEEYLQYRKDWKAEYKELSQRIRDRRFYLWYRSLGERRKTPKNDIRWTELDKKYETKIDSLYCMKQVATDMLEELKEAKQEAQRQYLAAKAQQELVTITK